jgi:anti-anti-sigma regulatory factor
MFRIEIATVAGREVHLALSGTVDAASLEELARLTSEAVSAGERVVVDLSNVRLVDREAVRFFSHGAGRQARLVGCPAYLREWLRSEGR